MCNKEFILKGNKKKEMIKKDLKLDNQAQAQAEDSKEFANFF